MIAVSGGGQRALQFALRHPDRCRALVMISACIAPLTARVPLRFHVMTLMARVPVLISRMRKRAAEDPEWAARRPIPDPALRAQTRNDPEAGPLLRSQQLSTLDRMADRLRGTRNDITQSRTVRLRAGADSGASLDRSRRLGRGRAIQAKSLAAALPKGELIPIPDGGHVALFTHRRLIQPLPWLGTWAVHRCSYRVLSGTHYTPLQEKLCSGIAHPTALGV